MRKIRPLSEVDLRLCVCVSVMYRYVCVGVCVVLCCVEFTRRFTISVPLPWELETNTEQHKSFTKKFITVYNIINYL